MQTIFSYFYPNIIEVQYLDPTIFTVRNRIVYSRTIKVYQGIDNPIQLMIKNQDQKAVNTTGYAVQLDIQDPDVKGSLDSIPIIMSNVTLGQGTCTITKAMANALAQRFYKLTVKLINTTTNAEQPLYIDDNYGAMIDLEVLPGWYESTPNTINNTVIIDGGTI